MKTGKIALALLPAAWLCLSAPARAALPNDVKLAPMFGTDGANKFVRPVWIGEIPGQRGSFLVAEQGNTNDSARLWVLEPGSGGGAYSKKNFLSLKVRTGDDEMGLLGFAFHPAFTENRKYYLSYIRPRAGASDSSIFEERTADATFKKDAGQAARPILSIPQSSPYHNGGTIGFGKDGYLYIGMGDDGGNGLGQSRQQLKASLLRIDVDHPSGGLGYSIPATNPFADTGAAGVRKEIWAYGLRNPWKFSFDPLSGDVWLADVGDKAQEEVDIVRRGDNMGWAVWEGTRCTGTTCAGDGFVPPIKSFARDSAICIIGGVVYRGNAGSPFWGAYLFGDSGSRHIWALLQQDRKLVELQRIAGSSATSFSAFGTDADGNVYLLGFGNGAVYLLDHPQLKPGSTSLRGPGSAPASAPLLREAAGFRLAPEWAAEALALETFSFSGARLSAWDAQGAQVAGQALLPRGAGPCLLKIKTRSGHRLARVFLD